jgi:hypothetical protein
MNALQPTLAASVKASLHRPIQDAARRAFAQLEELEVTLQEILVMRGEIRKAGGSAPADLDPKLLLLLTLPLKHIVRAGGGGPWALS